MHIAMRSNFLPHILQQMLVEERSSHLASSSIFYAYKEDFYIFFLALFLLVFPLYVRKVKLHVSFTAARGRIWNELLLPPKQYLHVAWEGSSLQDNQCIA